MRQGFDSLTVYTFLFPPTLTRLLLSRTVGQRSSGRRRCGYTLDMLTRTSVSLEAFYYARGIAPVCNKRTRMSELIARIAQLSSPCHLTRSAPPTDARPTSSLLHTLNHRLHLAHPYRRPRLLVIIIPPPLVSTILHNFVQVILKLCPALFAFTPPSTREVVFCDFEPAAVERDERDGGGGGGGGVGEGCEGFGGGRWGTEGGGVFFLEYCQPENVLIHFQVRVEEGLPAGKPHLAMSASPDEVCCSSRSRDFSLILQRHQLLSVSSSIVSRREVRYASGARSREHAYLLADRYGLGVFLAA